MQCKQRRVKWLVYPSVIVSGVISIYHYSNGIITNHSNDNSINVIIIYYCEVGEKAHKNNSSDNYPLWMDLHCHHHFYFPIRPQKRVKHAHCTSTMVWVGSWSLIPSHSQNWYEAKPECDFSVQIHQLQSSRLLIQLRNQKHHQQNHTNDYCITHHHWYDVLGISSATKETGKGSTH